MDIQRQGQLAEVLGSEMSNKYSVNTTDSSANTKTHSFDGRFLIPEPVVKFFHDGRELEISPNKDEAPYAAIARYVFELNDEIEKLKSELTKAQAAPELTDKMIVAIESEVESQLKASAIDADPFRLDGEEIWYAALEAQEPK